MKTIQTQLLIIVILTFCVACTPEPRKVDITNDSIIIGNVEYFFPIGIDTFIHNYGPTSRETPNTNGITYVWDELGIFCETKDFQNITSIGFLINQGKNYKFLPDNTFDGNIFVNGQEINTTIPETRQNHFVGDISILSFYNLDEGYRYFVSVQQRMRPTDLDKFKPSSYEGEVIYFSDFNFKLAVIQELMYKKELLKPKFDIYEFIERHQERDIYIEEEGYDFIPEVTKYFEELKIPKELLDKVETLEQDGGNEIYGQLIRFWNGEDETFNIQSADDARSLPNLKKVVLFPSTDSTLKKSFETMGIQVEQI